MKLKRRPEHPTWYQLLDDPRFCPTVGCVRVRRDWPRGVTTYDCAHGRLQMRTREAT